MYDNVAIIIPVWREMSAFFLHHRIVFDPIELSNIKGSISQGRMHAGAFCFWLKFTCIYKKYIDANFGETIF